MIHDFQIHRIRELRKCGYSQRQVAKELGINRRTVRKHWDAGPDAAAKPRARKRQRVLEPFAEKIRELYAQHRNCDVVRQEIGKDKAIPSVALRTIQEFLQPYRRELAVEEQKRKRADSRILSAPGDYFQVDFGSKTVELHGVRRRVHLLVCSLPYSKRVFAYASLDEKQDSWFKGVEQALTFFGGMPRWLTSDNASALVDDPARRNSRSCRLNRLFRAFCKHWGFLAVACKPYYPEAKGHVEKMVGYVKGNAVAGRKFESLAQLNEHLARWAREVADVREMRWLPKDDIRIPIDRFNHKEFRELKPLPPQSFRDVRELYRRVGAKGLLTIDNQKYQMDATYAHAEVRIEIKGRTISVFQGNNLIRIFQETSDAVQVTTLPPIDPTQVPPFGATDPALRPEPQDPPERDEGLYHNPLQAPLEIYDDITKFKGEPQ